MSFPGNVKSAIAGTLNEVGAKTGTSMSAPGVAAIVTGVRGFLRHTMHVERPSSALVRGIIYTLAREVTGDDVTMDGSRLYTSKRQGNDQSYGRVYVYMCRCLNR